MLIDWFTVSAQVLNFLILVWLLKRFLYKPILHAVDERESKIAAELKAADAKKAEAMKERDEFQKKNEAFDGQRAVLLKNATDEANSESARLVEDARKAAAALAAKRQETLKNEEQALHTTIVSRTQQEVFSIARKALTDLAGANLEERMVDIFVQRLSKLTAEKKQLLVAGGKATTEPMTVCTTSELSTEQRSTLAGAIKSALGVNAQVQFKTSPELLAGIELTVSGQKLGWNIADYLGALENGVKAHGL